MTNVMLNHTERHCYYNPVGVQDISDENDEATSHPIERVPSGFGATAYRHHLLPCQSMRRRVGHGSFYMVELIRPVYGRSVRRRRKRLFSYARKLADVQAEHFGRDTRVSHH